MIYFTTFIFTLLLAHAARAVPACGDVTSPEDMYDSMYDDEQLILATGGIRVACDAKYDNSSGDTNHTACPGLAHKYPHFKNFPSFPYIGATWDIKGHDSLNCGKCRKLTCTRSHKFIYFTAMDSPEPGVDVALPTAVCKGFISPACGPVEIDIVACSK
jgi:hypothetical protein